jgi:hypothetical protein
MYPLQFLGIVGLCTNLVTALFLCGAIVYDVREFLGPPMVVMCLSGVFTLAWFIVGLVIIGRSHSACVTQSTSLGVMSMIMIVLQGLGICCGTCKSGTEAE